MHELGVARQLIGMALQAAHENHARRITQFSIEMSRSVNESEDAFRFHLENASRGTLAEGAAFEITRVPVHLECLKCSSVFEQEYPGEPCPKCSSARVIPKAHDEFKLASIEID
jgi:hydrogenase nickel incorporation protein HypA/HybF